MHFCLMVIDSQGDTFSEEILEPYCEGFDVPKYSKGLVKKEELERFRNHYTSVKLDTGYGISDVNDHMVNSNLSLEELYAKYGEEWNHSAWEINEEGKFEKFSTYNPMSKWDWFEVGGRWDGTLLLKDGSKTNEACVEEIDFDNMRNTIATFAVLKDGRWYDKDDMTGTRILNRVVEEENKNFWKENFYDMFLKDLPPHATITIIDCHI